MTLRALIQAGGVDYLERQAHENPAPFLALLGRVMPREVHTELTAEVRIRQEVRRDLVQKLVVMLGASSSSEPLPAIAHESQVMLSASTDREQLSRRAENARRESLATVAGAVLRAAAMHDTAAPEARTFPRARVSDPSLATGDAVSTSQLDAFACAPPAQGSVRDA